MPDLRFARGARQGDDDRDVRQGRRASRLNEVHGDDDRTQDRTARVHDEPARSRTRELDATGDVIFHPDHQEIHLPIAGDPDAGVEWRTAPVRAAARAYGNGRVELVERQAGERDQTLDVDGAVRAEGRRSRPARSKSRRSNVDIAQLEKLALQNAASPARLNADATISGIAEAPGRRAAMSRSTTAGFQDLQVRQSLTAEVDFNGATIGLDATLQQSPTEALTAKGTMPMTLFQRSDAGHVARGRGDAIDLRVTSTPLESRHHPGLHHRGHERHRRAAGGRASDRLRRGPACRRLRRHQRRRVRRAARRRGVHGPRHAHRPQPRTSIRILNSRSSTRTASR